MDQMTLYLNIDRFQYENFKPLQSHTSVFSLMEPDTISGLINLPKPIISTMANYLYSGKREIKLDQNDPFKYWRV
jgi:hypothetical protein|nr:MAG TPA: hypothetical protein [Caudoviricetes sp.]